MKQVDWDELGPRLCDHLASVYVLSRHGEKVFPTFEQFTVALGNILVAARDDIVTGLGDQSEADVIDRMSEQVRQQILLSATSKGSPQ